MHKEATLGQFIKAARDRLTPEQLGLPRGRRRTPGLRREEVAMLCDISTTWYTWLEQGRTASVSSQVLAKLARVLHLSLAERQYLFKLAHQVDNDAVTEWSDTQYQKWSAMLVMINGPAYLMDRHWDVIAWNSECERLFQGWLNQASDHNLLRYIFFNPQAQTLIVDWQQRALRVVAEYRADSVTWQHDRVHLALIDELAAGSDVFAKAWQEQTVLAREGGLRRFMVEGKLKRFEQTTFRMADHPDIKLVLLKPETD